MFIINEIFEGPTHKDINTESIPRINLKQGNLLSNIIKYERARTSNELNLK